MKENFLPFSILAAAVIIGGSLIYTAGVSVDTPGKALLAENTDAPVVNDEVPIVANVSIDDDVILGDPNAPVTMIVFGDFQCPYCKQLFTDAETKIREKYVAEGKVKIVNRDFPLDQIHPFAREAAEAAECARDQGKYWMYHDALYTRQSEIGTTLDYIKLATELGMKEASFRACVTSSKYKDEVEKDYQDGVAAGVQGTPATFINGKMISGARPYASFEAEIESALKSS